MDTLERMASDDNTDVSVHEAMADALLLRAWIAHKNGDSAQSLRSLDEVRTHLQAIEASGALTDERRGRLAAALVMAGEIQSAENDLPAAEESWSEALNQLAQVSDTTASPYVRDPLARALFWSGQPDQASQVRQELQAHGYTPIRPWPEAPDTHDE
jgi:hypothetical protein